MLDLRISKDFKGSGQNLNILIMQNADQNYCTASRDWSKVIKKKYSKARSLNFEKLYQEKGHDKFFSFIKTYVQKNKINVLYFDAPISPSLSLNELSKLKEFCFIVVVLDDNALFFNDWFRYISQCVDLVLSHDYVEKFRYRLYGTDALFFPQVTDIDYFYNSNVDIDEKNILVSSVGRVDRVGRRELVDDLETSNLGFVFYGPGTKNGFISREKRIEIYQKSKMSLNFSGGAEYFHGTHVQKIEKNIKQVKGRLWELALSKTLILTEYAPYLEKSFEPGKEVELFQTKEDLLRIVNYYKTNEDKLREMAYSGYKRAKKDLNPIKTIELIFDYISYKVSNRNRIDRKIVIKEDFIFKKLIADSRSKRALSFLKKGAGKSFVEEVKLSFQKGIINLFLFTFFMIKEGLKTATKKIPFSVSIVRYLKTSRSYKS